MPSLSVLVQRYQRADYHVVVGFGLAFDARHTAVGAGDGCHDGYSRAVG